MVATGGVTKTRRETQMAVRKTLGKTGKRTVEVGNSIILVGEIQGLAGCNLNRQPVFLPSVLTENILRSSLETGDGRPLRSTVVRNTAESDAHWTLFLLEIMESLGKE